eukprot:TRINITY_DN12399_c0_g1_i1.p1 TRINITY_DN12399_c0_g1~~TRINITY_DN12399_c0_g1_i1.p1  ORF type:complete len:733 (+),score=123.02 TRINITY_DN12399_c0_g1_i1:41-2200(+)
MAASPGHLPLSEEVTQLVIYLVREEVGAQRNVSVRDIRTRCEQLLKISLVDQRSEIRDIIHIAAATDQGSIIKLRDLTQQKRNLTRSATLLQKVGRGCLHRQFANSMKATITKSCKTIEAVWLGYQCRNFVKLLWKSATQVQSVYRSHATRQHQKMLQRKVTCIQRYWRRHHQQRDIIVKNIQRVCRGFCQRKEAGRQRGSKKQLLHRVFISYSIRRDIHQRHSYLSHLRLQSLSTSLLQRVFKGHAARIALSSSLYTRRQSVSRIIAGYLGRKRLWMMKDKLAVLKRIIIGYRDRYNLWKQECDTNQRMIVRAWCSFKVRRNIQNAVRRSSSARMIQQVWKVKNSLRRQRSSLQIINIEDGDEGHEPALANSLVERVFQKPNSFSSATKCSQLTRDKSDSHLDLLKKQSLKKRRRKRSQPTSAADTINLLKKENDRLKKRKAELELSLQKVSQPTEEEEIRTAAAIQAASNKLRMELVENARLRAKEKRISEIQQLKDKISEADENLATYRRLNSEMRKVQLSIDKKLIEIEDTGECEAKNQRRMKGDLLVTEGCAKRTSDQIRLGKMTIKCQRERINRLISQDIHPELSLADVIQIMMSRKKVESVSEEIASLQTEYDRLLHCRQVLNKRYEQTLRSSSIQQSLQIELHKLTRQLRSQQPAKYSLSPHPPPRKQSESDQPPRVRYPSWLQPPSPKQKTASRNCPQKTRNSNPIWLKE